MADLIAPAPHPGMIVPFALLLAAIALGPLVAGKWWQHHYPKVAYGLGGATLAYYLFGLHAYTRVLHVGHEYVSFMALVGSLFVVSGGIHFTVKGEATPAGNVLFLLVGAVLANGLGTTGASMLLIRPWLHMNRRHLAAHHVVFFIFIVSNIGGCLTPIGDPPLFLGYLKGVPFWWVAENCWPMWTVGMAALLAIFALLDWQNTRRPGSEIPVVDDPASERWQVAGAANLIFLAVILAAVFVKNPPFLREALMVAAALGSYFTTPRAVHAANVFNFHPIQEVGILFIGIFATMMPALDWLAGNAARLGEPSVGLVYWLCGVLSSLLDNAPTYLSFLSSTLGSLVPSDVVPQVQAWIAAGGGDPGLLTGTHAEGLRRLVEALPLPAGGGMTADAIGIGWLLHDPVGVRHLVAISVASVFFGANTYIGNGPNFMVKSIAEQRRAPVPGFPGFILKFTLPFLIPVQLVVWWLFFRG